MCVAQDLGRFSFTPQKSHLTIPVPSSFSLENRILISMATVESQYPLNNLISQDLGVNKVLIILRTL